MKFSYNWIHELVEGLEASPADLTRLITIKTAECEGVEAAGAHFAQVVAARILEVEAIPGSHNRRAVADAGPLGRRTVVCGAPNCRAGIVTAYVPAGVFSKEGRSAGAWLTAWKATACWRAAPNSASTATTKGF